MIKFSWYWSKGRRTLAGKIILFANKTGGVKDGQYCAIMTQSIQAPPLNCFGIVSLSAA